jgi:hypothetical protein
VQLKFRPGSATRLVEYRNVLCGIGLRRGEGGFFDKLKMRPMATFLRILRFWIFVVTPCGRMDYTNISKCIRQAALMGGVVNAPEMASHVLVL